MGSAALGPLGKRLLSLGLDCQVEAVDLVLVQIINPLALLVVFPQFECGKGWGGQVEEKGLGAS
jgi:hypothetical protein